MRSDCSNCDGRKCMGCVFREYDHDCADDCPFCCGAPGIRVSEYNDVVKPARDEEALHLLRTDPAEYFRRTRVQAQWFRPDPEALRLLGEEYRRLAPSERRWERRLADFIYREDEL